MTKLLEEAIKVVRNLSEGDQDMVAKFLLSFVNPEAHRYQLSEEQVTEVKLARHEVREGKFATEAEMAEVWARFGP